jgi:glucosamine--fructose-6-phosphate aminotransferase (isomerizing)
VRSPTWLEGEKVERAPKTIDWSPRQAEKAGYKHFMLKEIHEQPRAIEDTLRGRIDLEPDDVSSAEIGLTDADAKAIKRVVLLACGTSHHAVDGGRYLIESLARIPVVVELASEFRGRDPVVGEGDLVVAVSQSGETLDTLVAVKEAKEKGAKVLAIANVIDSAIPRAGRRPRFYTHAGPEIGVASTKCFTAQLAMVLLAIYLGRRARHARRERARELLQGSSRIPHTCATSLEHGDALQATWRAGTWPRARACSSSAAA